MWDKLRAKKLLERYERYSSLYANEEFQNWKKEVVESRLKNYDLQSKTQDMDTGEGREKSSRYIIKYQELKYILEDIFKIFEQQEKRIRKELDRDKKTIK